jgi:hypothetical protein
MSCFGTEPFWDVSLSAYAEYNAIGRSTTRDRNFREGTAPERLYGRGAEMVQPAR